MEKDDGTIDFPAKEDSPEVETGLKAIDAMTDGLRNRGLNFRVLPDLCRKLIKQGISATELMSILQRTKDALWYINHSCRTTKERDAELEKATRELRMESREKIAVALLLGAILYPIGDYMIRGSRGDAVREAQQAGWKQGLEEGHQRALNEIQAQAERNNDPDFLRYSDPAPQGMETALWNSERIDKYIFNAITGNDRFAFSFGVARRVKLRKGEMPYRGYFFKAFDQRSNTILPSRLGEAVPGGTLADLINTVTTLRAKDLREIQTIISTSYDLSFGIAIAREDIGVIANPDGSVQAIKYIGGSPEKLKATTEIATKTRQDKKNNEQRNLAKIEKAEWALVDKDGNLFFPPSVYVDQGIIVPPSVLKPANKVAYVHRFSSQGKSLNVPIEISINNIVNTYVDIDRKNCTLYAGGQGSFGDPYCYMFRDDAFAKDIARKITDSFQTPRQKLQAIMDFVHSFPYILTDEEPKTLEGFLLAKGGKCSDTAPLTTELARAIGISCVVVDLSGKRGHHLSTACDVKGSGTAFRIDDTKYEWAESVSNFFGEATGHPAIGKSPIPRAGQIQLVHTGRGKWTTDFKKVPQPKPKPKDPEKDYWDNFDWGKEPIIDRWRETEDMPSPPPHDSWWKRPLPIDRPIPYPTYKGDRITPRGNR